MPAAAVAGDTAGFVVAWFLCDNPVVGYTPVHSRQLVSKFITHYTHAFGGAPSPLPVACERRSHRHAAQYARRGIPAHPALPAAPKTRPGGQTACLASTVWADRPPQR